MALPLAGDPVYSTDITRPLYIRKSANQSVTSSTVKVADADFVIALPIGVFRIETVLAATGADAGGVSINWAFTGTTASSNRIGIGPGTSSTTYDNHETLVSSAKAITSSIAYGTDAGGAVGIREDLHLEISVTGTLTMQWAQNVSNATATTLTGSSRMIITQLEPF